MNKALVFLLLALLPLSIIAQNTLSIIPQPQKLKKSKGTFRLNLQTHYHVDTTLAKNAISYLQAHLKYNAGYVLSKTTHKQSNSIHFQYKNIQHAEGYKLTVTTKDITIQAKDTAGFFYAVVSLLQTMHPKIWETTNSPKVKKYYKKSWIIPALTIEDYPHYVWRGLMLDSSRNFFSVAYIKKFIDRMAQYKLNRFHWHLSDDEGWRMESKHYPLLTQVGARRGTGTHLPFSTYPTMRGKNNKVQSGYYSQKEMKEIVAYAKARSVEILPEIDMPAHAKAALVAYPTLLNDPKDKSLYRSVQKVQNNTMNPALESSYIFIDNIISELTEIFPFDYIHIGGDEIPKGAWKRSPAVKSLMKKYKLKNVREVQNYFFKRVDTILLKHHRKMIAWQEVLKGRTNVRHNAIFMAWKSVKATKSIIKQKRNVIMSPVQYLYFDQQYHRKKGEPGRTWSTPVSTKKVYSLPQVHSSYVQGVHACLWSEIVMNESIADYLTWPRALALAEVAWTKPKLRVWKEFKYRLKHAGIARLKAQSIHYY